MVWDLVTMKKLNKEAVDKALEECLLENLDKIESDKEQSDFVSRNQSVVDAMVGNLLANINDQVALTVQFANKLASQELEKGNDKQESE